MKVQKRFINHERELTALEEHYAAKGTLFASSVILNGWNLNGLFVWLESVLLMKIVEVVIILLQNVGKSAIVIRNSNLERYEAGRDITFSSDYKNNVYSNDNGTGHRK